MAVPIARRYAHAIFALAAESHNFDQWEADLANIAETFTHSEVAGFLRNPKGSPRMKTETVRQLLADRIQPLALNYALLLVERHRQQAATAILAGYRDLHRVQQGIVTARVTTAIALSDDETSAITEALSRKVGQQVVVEASVDPRILGGVVARVGDRLIDGSVLAKLKALRSELLQGA